jgi:hypothetical protein
VLVSLEVLALMEQASVAASAVLAWAAVSAQKARSSHPRNFGIARRNSMARNSFVPETC